jgi:hypothetical protein
MSSFKIDLLNISMNETHLPEVLDKLVAMNISYGQYRLDPVISEGFNKRISIFCKTRLLANSLIIEYINFTCHYSY